MALICCSFTFGINHRFICNWTLLPSRRSTPPGNWKNFRRKKVLTGCKLVFLLRAPRVMLKGEKKGCWRFMWFFTTRPPRRETRINFSYANYNSETSYDDFYVFLLHFSTAALATRRRRILFFVDITIKNMNVHMLIIKTHFLLLISVFATERSKLLRRTARI